MEFLCQLYFDFFLNFKIQKTFLAKNNPNQRISLKIQHYMA